MKNLDYKLFKESFDDLSKEHQLIITTLLKNLEHHLDMPKDEIKYSDGLKIAMKERGYSYNDLVHEIEKRNNGEEINNTIVSAIVRGSKNSMYFQDILDILEIDEAFLIQNSTCIQSRINSMEWCFESLSDINKEAVYHLVIQLSNSSFSLYMDGFNDLNNIGIDEACLETDNLYCQKNDRISLDSIRLQDKEEK